MATRFYFPNDVVAPQEPDLNAAGYWDDVASAERFALLTAKQASAFESAAVAETSASERNVLLRQYVSNPLEPGQVIAGTIKGQVRGMESDLAANMSIMLMVEVFRVGETIPMATLYDGWPSVLGTEFAASLTNRSAPASDVLFDDTYETVEGDYIVVSLGYRAFNTSTTSYTGTLEFGDNSESDLPENEVATDQYCPWIEFSQTLVFAGGFVADGTARVVGTSTYTDPDALTDAYAPTGAPEGSGYGVLNLVTPGLPEYAATGAVKSAGYSILGTGLLASDYIATGRAMGAGYGFLQSSTAAGLTDAYVAAGRALVKGRNTLNFVDPTVDSPLINAYLSGGHAAVYGRCALTVAAPADLTKAYAAYGAAQVLGAGILDEPAATLTNAFIAFGFAQVLTGTVTVGHIKPPITAMASIGGAFVESPELVDDSPFDTYAFNGTRMEPSIYSNFNFNSFAQRQGKTYGAGADGIYLLEGADDDGEEINPGVRIVTNFGLEKDKRLRGINLGRCGDEAQVRVEDDEGNVGYFTPDSTYRVVVSRNLQGKQFTLDIADFSVLSQLEITVLPLARK